MRKNRAEQRKAEWSRQSGIGHCYWVCACAFSKNILGFEAGIKIVCHFDVVTYSWHVPFSIVVAVFCGRVLCRMHMYLYITRSHWTEMSRMNWISNSIRISKNEYINNFSVCDTTTSCIRQMNGRNMCAAFRYLCFYVLFFRCVHQIH